jgi:hypothetical protein
MPDGTPDDPLTDRPAPERRPCSAAPGADDEPLGGDPPCWAHLFEDEPEPTGR